MLSRVLRATVVSAALAVFVLPAAANLAVGLHLASRHHHHHDDAGAAAFALAHGHRHEVGVPHHRHDATAPEAPARLVALGVATDAPHPSLIAEDPLLEVGPPALHPTHSPPASSLTPLRL